MKNRVSHLFEPFKAFQLLQQEIDRQFSEFAVDHSARQHSPVEVWRNEEGAILRIELPGVDLNDIDVSVNGSHVHVNANRNLPDVGENENSRLNELIAGEQGRVVEMPFEVDAEKIDASYLNGVLTISVSKSSNELPQKVVVKAG